MQFDQGAVPLNENCCSLHIHTGIYCTYSGSFQVGPNRCLACCCILLMIYYFWSSSINHSNINGNGKKSENSFQFSFVFDRIFVYIQGVSEFMLHRNRGYRGGTRRSRFH
uniref:Uncharacterized protein n=1 Tax=Strigamia maritima TaxID=126957 RepID=T1IMA7_STRMM